MRMAQVLASLLSFCGVPPFPQNTIQTWEELPASYWWIDPHRINIIYGCYLDKWPDRMIALVCRPTLNKNKLSPSVIIKRKEVFPTTPYGYFLCVVYYFNWYKHRYWILWASMLNSIWYFCENIKIWNLCKFQIADLSWCMQAYVHHSDFNISSLQLHLDTNSSLTLHLVPNKDAFQMIKKARTR